MAQVKLTRSIGTPNFCFELVFANTGKEIEFIDTDWSYPPTANIFGWQACKCGRSDGTVDCETCNRNRGDMMAEAYDFLEKHLNAGTVVECSDYDEDEYQQ